MNVRPPLPVPLRLGNPNLYRQIPKALLQGIEESDDLASCRLEPLSRNAVEVIKANLQRLAQTLKLSELLRPAFAAACIELHDLLVDALEPGLRRLAQRRGIATSFRRRRARPFLL